MQIIVGRDCKEGGREEGRKKGRMGGRELSFYSDQTFLIAISCFILRRDQLYITKCNELTWINH